MTQSLETPVPTSLARRKTAEELCDYLVELGALLSRYGCPAYRVETFVRVVGKLEGHEAQAFALPTGLFVGVEPTGSSLRSPIIRMVRLEGMTVNLDRLLAVDALFNEVADGHKPIEAARQELDTLEERPLPYARPVRLVGAMLVSSGGAIFFRGSPVDVAASALIGLLIFAISEVTRRRKAARFLLEFFGAVLASLVASFALSRFTTASREAILLGGMISLMPGMTFTTGLAEIAQKNLVSGAARLVESLVTLLSLAAGIGIGVTLASSLGSDASGVLARSQPALPTELLAAVMCSLGFGIGFSVPRRLLWAALVSGGLGYLATRFGVRYFQGHIAAFVASLTVCSAANGLARLTRRPAQLYHLPGMMLLVPGTFGFLSIDDLMRGEITRGASRAIDMLIVASSLVMGVLMANVLVPPRKLL